MRGLDPSTFSESPRLAKSIRAKLRGKPLRNGPQLVIIENDFIVFDEPNPYSNELFKLPSGTGVYVIKKTHGLVSNWVT